MTPVENGRLQYPIPLHLDAGLAGFMNGSPNVAFRFLAALPGKTSARDAFECGRINLRFAARPPAKFPTWGQIGEICVELNDLDLEWAFSMADRAAA